MNLDMMLLIGVIAFLLIMFYQGFHKGLLRIVLTIAATVLSIVLSVALAGPFETFIRENTSIEKKVNRETKQYVEKYVSPELNKATEKMQKEAIQKMDLPEALQKKLIKNNTVEKQMEMGVQNFTDYLSVSLGNMLIKSLAVMIIFISIKIILGVIIEVLDLVSRLPVLEEVNRTTGGLVGLAEGILILWVACLLLTACSSTPTGQDLFNAVSNNQVLSFIYNNNLLVQFLL